MADAASGWKRIDLGASEDSGERSGALTTFIDRGCEFEGRLVLEQSIRIDGEFRGEVETSESVIIGSSAAVQANIRARTVVVHGAVAGDLAASREVVLHPTSRVTGSVETPSLVVERGAYLSGETRMFRPELAARQRAATKESSSEKAASATTTAPRA
jgi:cytoskeletal protein CcmA (bactofilin family)